MTRILSQILKHRADDLETTGIFRDAADQKTDIPDPIKKNAIVVVRAGCYHSERNDALFELLLNHPKIFNLLCGPVGNFRKNNLGSVRLYDLLRLSSDPVMQLQDFCGHSSPIPYATQFGGIVKNTAT